MYNELIKRLRAGAISADSGNTISESLYSDIMQAADVIEELQKYVPKRSYGRLGDLNAVANQIVDDVIHWEPKKEKS